MLRKQNISQKKNTSLVLTNKTTNTLLKTEMNGKMAPRKITGQLKDSGIQSVDSQNFIGAVWAEKQAVSEWGLYHEAGL